MNEFLRDRIMRKLDALSDERGYQILDYVEFLDSKYAERQAANPNVFTRFTEGVEDTMRAGRISATTIAETMGFLNKAMGALNGVAAAGKSVASDLVNATRTPTSPPGRGTSPAQGENTSVAATPNTPASTSRASDMPSASSGDSTT